MISQIFTTSHDWENTKKLGALSNSLRSKKKRFGFSFKTPSPKDGGLFAFWYRSIIILLCTVPAFFLLVILGSINNFQIEPWMYIASVVFVAPALVFGELMRQSLFDRIIRIETKKVYLKVSSSGVHVTSPRGKILLESSRENSERAAVFYEKYGKRIFDLVLASLGILAFSPLMLMLSILIKFESPGPAFFRQERIGRHDKPFYLLKFRSMHTNANEQLEQLLATNEFSRKEWAKMGALKNDPRLTPIGTFLRQSSLDELPQLFNVLKGDMSIVGPRPILPAEAEYLNVSPFKVRPGLTGPWRGIGNNISRNARQALSNEYAENVNQNADLKILISSLRSLIYASDD